MLGSHNIRNGEASSDAEAAVKAEESCKEGALATLRLRMVTRQLAARVNDFLGSQA